MSYYMYEDGSSYWGISLTRGGETPRKISRAMHQLKWKSKGKWIW